MNYKLRAILTVVVGFAAVLMLIGALVQWVIRPAFQELEHSRALEDSGRAAVRENGPLSRRESLITYCQL